MTVSSQKNITSTTTQTMTQNKFWNFIKNEESESVELRIEGNIVDDEIAWLYEWFDIPASSPNAFRKELSQYKNQDITVWIDSYGGDVFAAAGIYNALKEHKGKVTVKIDGKAMSAASVIAMAGDEILMSPVAIMMIHNPLTGAQGDARVMRKAADVLDMVKETIINAYVTKAKKTREEIASMMDDETWMSANAAVKEGFADDVLYSDAPIEISNIKDFAFNRFAIVNSLNTAIHRLSELESKNNFNNSSLKNNKEEEEKIMNAQELKEKHPDVYNEVYKQGQQDERERIKNIEDVAFPGFEDLVNKAKFENNISAEKLAIEIIKANKEKGNAYLVQAKEDAKEIDEIEGEAPETETKNQQKTEAVNKLANYLNKRRGN